MLVLARKKEEAVTCFTTDGPITLLIANVGRTTVRVGIDAPPCVQILRTELVEKTEEIDA